jgi:hypothetical protein
VFYRTAQANVMETPANKNINKIVRYLGLLFAPKEFQRLDLRIELLKKQQLTSVSTLEHIDSVSIKNEPESINVMTFYRRMGEFAQWQLKITGWYIFWMILEAVCTYPIDGDMLLQPNSEVFDTCSITAVRFIGVVLLIWNSMQLAIVLSCLKWVNDSYAIKAELIFMQVLFCLLWGADGFLQAIVPQVYNDVGVWLDLTVILFHRLITFGFPVGLHVWRSYSRKVLKSENSKVRSIEDLMHVWSKPAGRTAIMEIAAKKFALENVLFLSETDDFQFRFQPKKVTELYKKYFVRDSPFELNLPVKILGTDNEKRVEVVEEARKHVFQIVFTNFRDELERELSLDASFSGTSLTIKSTAVL